MKSIRKELYLYIAGLVLPLAAALYSQYAWGLHPCEMCIWQRWAYAVAIFFIANTFVFSAPKAKNIFNWLSAISVFICTIIATFHFGVEQKWWEGFTACTGDFSAAKTLEDLKAMIEAAPVIRCDEPAWVFILSMAGWNALYSLALGIFGTIFICKQKSI